MRTLLRFSGPAIIVAAGCGSSPAQTESHSDSERNGALIDPSVGATQNADALTDAGSLDAATPPAARDDDGDGLDDAKEDWLLTEHAPVLYLPRSLDWTMPANVDWYLARTNLRFHHRECSDCSVLGVGAVSQTTLLAQSHHKKNPLADLSSCSHRSDVVSSSAGPWDPNHHFFLQPSDDAVHAGSSSPADWIVYGHVYPGTQGTQVQYWFFYPYNDNLATFDHEADWESIIVSLGANDAPMGVRFCAHGDCSKLVPIDDVTWFASTHPYVWVAEGSHASYPDQATCDANFVLEGASTKNCETNDEHRWFSWAGGLAARAGLQGGGVVNVGEVDAPRNGQLFVRYEGRWGELGVIDDTSGPPGPAMQASWNLDRKP